MKYIRRTFKGLLSILVFGVLISIPIFFLTWVLATPERIGVLLTIFFSVILTKGLYEIGKRWEDIG